MSECFYSLKGDVRWGSEFCGSVKRPRFDASQKLERLAVLINVSREVVAWQLTTAAPRQT